MHNIMIKLCFTEQSLVHRQEANRNYEIGDLPRGAIDCTSAIFKFNFPLVQIRLCKRLLLGNDSLIVKRHKLVHGVFHSRTINSSF